MSGVGVLALQGAFVEHEKALADLGAESFEIRKASDLDLNPDALIIPGGESTVMGKLIRDLGMYDRIRSMIQGGTPVFGTCAGMIMLAQDVEGGITHLGTMPIAVRRNAYGRQLGSFSATAPFADKGEIPLEFIRAPAVTSVSEGVQVLATVDSVPVAVRYGNQLATAFHPEFTSDRTVHRYFLDMI